MHRAHGVRRPGPPRPGHASPSEVEDARVILRGKARLLQRPDSAHVQHQDVQYQDVRKQGGGLPTSIAALQQADSTRYEQSLRLSPGEARDVVQALPPALRGVLQPCEQQGGARESFGREEFLRRVAERLAVSPTDAERSRWACSASCALVSPRRR